MFIEMRNLPQKTGISRSLIYRHIAEGKFPPAVHLSKRTSRWVEEEVDAILKARIAGADDAEIKKLVLELVARRTS